MMIVMVVAVLVEEEVVVGVDGGVHRDYGEGDKQSVCVRGYECVSVRVPVCVSGVCMCVFVREACWGVFTWEDDVSAYVFELVSMCGCNEAALLPRDLIRICAVEHTFDLQKVRVVMVMVIIRMILVVIMVIARMMVMVIVVARAQNCGKI